MADIAELGFAIDSKPLADTKQSFDEVTTAAGKMEKAVERSAAATTSASAKIAADMQKAAEVSTSAADRAAERARRAPASFDPSYFQKMADAATKVNTALGGSGGGGVSDAVDQLTPRMNRASQAASALASSMGSGGGGGGGTSQGAAGAAEEAAQGFTLSSLAIRVMIGLTVAAIAAYAAFVVVLTRVAEAHEKEMRHLTSLAGARSQAVEYYRAIAEFANSAGISLQIATDKAVAFARAGSDLGVTAQTMLGVASTVEKLSQLGGATTGESNTAQNALIKIFEGSKVSANDLKTVLQSVPGVVEQIARGLGLSVIQLRLLATEGKLTSDQVLSGLLRQQREVSDNFEKLPRTTGQAFQSLLNDIGEMVTRWSLLAPFVNAYKNAIEGAAKAAHALNEATKPERPDQVIARTQDAITAVGPSAATMAGRPGQPSATGAVGNAKAVQEYTAALNALEQSEIDATNAVVKGLREQANAALLAGTTIAQTIDPITTKLNKLAEEDKFLNDALAALKTNLAGLPAAEVASRTDQLTDAIRRVRIEAENTASAAEKMWQQLNRRDAQNAMGMTEAQRNMAERVRQLTATGDISESAATALVDRAQVQTVLEMVEAKEREADAQEAMTKANYRGKDAMIQAAAAAALLEWQLKNVGASTEEAQVAMDVLVERYTNAVGRISTATAARGGANASKPLLDELAGIAAAMKAVEQGAYAMRKAEAEAKAARSTDGTGKLQMQVFDAKQGLTDATTIQNLKLQVDLTNQLAAAVGNVALQKQIQLEFDIKKAQMDAAPAARGQIAEQMKAQATADSALALANLLDESKKYVEQQEMEQQAVLLGAEAAAKLRFEYEMLQKAKAQGITVDPAVISDSASAMARAAQKTSDMKQMADLGKSAFVGFFTSINQGLQQGQSLWQAFGNAGLNALNMIASKLMEMAATKLFESAFGGSGGGGGGGFLGGILSGIFGGGGATASSGASGILAGITAGGGIGAGIYAEGGNYPAGQPRIVGERGWELDVPRTSGTVFNQKQLADMMSGGGSQEVTVRISLESEMLNALIDGRSQNVVTKAAPRIINRSVKQATKLAPSAIAKDHNTRGGDFRNGL